MRETDWHELAQVRSRMPERSSTTCYTCTPPYDWQTPRALKEHKRKTGH